MVRSRNALAARIFFGDRRLDKRLGRVFNQAVKRPGGTLPQKLVGRAELAGGYRLLNNAKVTHGAVLAAHRASCRERLAGHQGKVLLLHDTTVADYSGLDVDDGLGQIGDGHGKGLYLHNTLAVIPSTRQVVGLLNQIVHKRADAPWNESKSARRSRPDRESRLWKQGVSDLPDLPVGVWTVDVSDRGSDLSEYIWHEVASGRLFIVRGVHDRRLLDDEGAVLSERLHPRLRGLAPTGQYTLRVPAEDGGWREARMGLAFAPLSLAPPRQPRGEHDDEPIDAVGVIARELDPPDDAEPIEWILLTNLPVASAEQAREVVDDYAFRWMVEEYHKAMKTGCGIEQTQLTTRGALDNFIAITSVLAVHVLRLRCNARDEPTRAQPARLHDEELKVRLVAAHAKHPDWRTMTVWDYFIAVAKLGGYVLNPRKRPPGWLVLWRGYVRLEDMCEGVRVYSERCVQT